MKRHKSTNGCLRHTAESKKIKYQFSPEKTVAVSYNVEEDEEDYDEDEEDGLLYEVKC